MIFTNIGIINENFEYEAAKTVITKDGTIVFVGDSVPEEYKSDTNVYDGTGKVMIPGVVNSHTHSAMTLMRGYGENMVLSDWLNKKIFPFEAHFIPDTDAIINATLLACAEMFRFGTVACTDMYYNLEGMYTAAKTAGIKMDFGLALTTFDDTPVKKNPLYSELNSFVSAHGGEDYYKDCFNADLVLHAEYTSTEKAVRELVEIAGERPDSRMHVHVSETSAEVEGCKERHDGKTPVKYLYDLGLFDIPTTAAHCVWLEGDDFELLKDKNVTVACNPVSNLKLASGFDNIPMIKAEGVNIALGTDGVASNNNLNLFEEMKLFSILYKASSQNPTLISPKEAFYSLTRAGAIAQGRKNSGYIKEGFDADLAVLDLRGAPYMIPCHDMLNNLVFASQGSDVCLTMVGGKVVYRDGEYPTIDLERVAFNVGASLDRILSKLEVDS